MSSLAVRQLAEDWVDAIGTIPYYSTINSQAEPQDNLWVTLDFEVFGYTKQTYCGDFLEDGEIRLIFLGRVGVGQDSIIQAAETFADLFMDSIDPAGKLVLLQRSPPADYSGRDDPWFVVEIAVEYQF